MAPTFLSICCNISHLHDTTQSLLCQSLLFFQKCKGDCIFLWFWSDLGKWNVKKSPFLHMLIHFPARQNFENAIYELSTIIYCVFTVILVDFSVDSCKLSIYNVHYNTLNCKRIRRMSCKTANSTRPVFSLTTKRCYE